MRVGEKAEGGPDALTEEALRHWLPRLIANGVDWNDAQKVLSRVSSWREWCRAWWALAEVHEARAREALAGGRRLTGGEALARASLYSHFAQFVFFEDLQEKARAQARKVALYREALPLLQPPGRRIEVPFEGTSLPGILRLPPGGAGGEGAPCVLLLAGLDSTKEEFHTFEPLFHARGLATFAFDGPGQGERGDLPLRADFETAVGAVAEFLGREGLDGGGRLGALGVSTGGYYAARAAARVPRLRATVAVGGFYDLAGCWEGLPRLTRQGFAHAMGGVSEEEARERGEALSLQGVLGALRTPLLIVHGDQDRICPPAEARRMAEEARRSGAEVELRLYPEGNHVCNNLPHLYRPLAADWLGERLRAAPHHMV